MCQFLDPLGFLGFDRGERYSHPLGYTLLFHAFEGQFHYLGGVLLEFWASWCGPFRSDIPHLKQVYDIYNPHGFEMISILMDSDKALWFEAVEEE